MKFSKERYRHWPVDWYADTSQFMCNNWNRRNLLVELKSDVKSLCIHIHHRRMPWILGQHHTKTVMITDVLLMTRKHLAATSFKHQTVYCFNTVLHQRTLHGRGTINESEVLLPLSSNATSFVRWRINRSNCLLFQHSATPKDLTWKGNYKWIWGAGSTVQQRYELC